MSRDLETAIRGSVPLGARIPTPTGRATFKVQSFTDQGLVLLLGAKETRSPIAWSTLQGCLTDIKGRGWVLVAAARDAEGRPGTLDAYLKASVPRQVANYVAVILELAGILDLDRGRPSRVRAVDPPSSS